MVICTTVLLFDLLLASEASKDGKGAQNFILIPNRGGQSRFSTTLEVVWLTSTSLYFVILLGSCSNRISRPFTSAYGTSESEPRVSRRRGGGSVS